jgi:ubiquinone/menaquinone biosynthesis C-methylase UbiE
MVGPNKDLAIEKYGGLAGSYDRLVKAAERVRRDAVTHLKLEPGDVVLDVGSGTGLSFPLIQEQIGSAGQIVGIDLSPEMLARARERVKDAGWGNVTLIESAIEDAAIPAETDAAFFNFTHDIMRSAAALENVFQHVKPGGRVVSAGGKWAPWWALPVNIYMRRVARQYVTTFEGYRKPWSLMTRYLPDLQVRSALFGAAYIAWGTLRLSEH